MAENYASTLQGPDLDRYVKKLQCLFGRVGESYMSTLGNRRPVSVYQHWMDWWHIIMATCGLSKFVYVFYWRTRWIHAGEAQGIQKSWSLQLLSEVCCPKWCVH